MSDTSALARRTSAPIEVVPDVAGDFVVKSESRTQYVQALGPDGASVEGWTSCQRCAARFNRPTAHRIAHIHGRAMVVIRIVARPRLGGGTSISDDEKA